MRSAAWVLVVVVAAAGGAWVGATLGAKPRAGSTSDPDAADATALARLAVDIGSLHDALARERQERDALATRVDELSERIATLAAPPSAGPTRAAAAAPDADPQAEPGPDAPAARRDDPETRSPEEEARHEREVLVAAGFDARDVDAYRERVDALELQRLFLRDEAMRDGWAGTPRFRDEMESLDAEMQRAADDVGAGFRDWALYARGEPNRVGVEAVMAGSPAERAGLRAGDIVLRYGEAEPRRPGELQRATRGGNAGESTEVELLRDGRRLTVVVPRGPLGVRIEPLSVAPDAAR